ncbi:histidine kinase [Pontibacter sp. E15-1]|uniref:sensor histidine kinase n=1 Tax=Pontibacter sp. E15-1 TaxID=2919918 RepID=UPI001F501C5D|nr:histidine kinase [Pontibacter sp. E15-1]MCJ8167376.1 histidine kinase [Pontibacter sp. E15-1]
MNITLREVTMKRRYKLALHVAGWLIFGAWIFYFVYANRSLTLHKGLDITVGLLFHLLIFYFNWYVLIPRYLARNQILLYVFAVVTMLLSVAVLQAPFDYYIFREYNPGMDTLYSTERLLQYMLGGLVTTFISSALKVTGNYIRNERRNKELETQKLITELAYLKSQVNPHFLFNTLNNIYSLAYKQHPETPDAIMKLSLLMRYMLYESNDTMVSLEKEVEHINNFIALQKLRLREHTGIRFEVQGELANRQIAPMLLMTLVENAFKHGLVSKNEIGIQINLTVQEDALLFSTVNNTSSHKKREFGGIGLTNLRRRLNLLYPNQHLLAFEEKDGAFYATLKLYFRPNAK